MRFVEELALHSAAVGFPRAVVRVLGWMVVCDPPEQTAPQLRASLGLSAGAISTATRQLIEAGLLVRTDEAGAPRYCYCLVPDGWEGLLARQFKRVAVVAELADGALAAAPVGAQARLTGLRDAYREFGTRLETLLPARP